MRLGANVLVGGGSSADFRFCPGLRKRCSIAGLLCSEGCNRSLLAPAALPDDVCARLCARLSPGCMATSAITANAASDVSAIAAIAGTPARRLERDNPAIKAGIGAAVRVTSEAAKAHHHCGAEMAP